MHDERLGKLLATLTVAAVAADWISFWSGVSGGVIGAGGAIGASFVGAWRERRAHEDDRVAQRNDRLTEQGRVAAREALSIITEFFSRKVAPGDAFRVLTEEQLREVGRINDLAELITNDDARLSVRALVFAIGDVNVYVESVVEAGGARESHAVHYRERHLVTVLRDVLGAYLREEAKTLIALRETAEGEEESTRAALGMLGYED